MDKSIKHAKTNKLVLSNTSYNYILKDLNILLAEPNIFTLYENVIMGVCSTYSIKEDYFYRPERVSNDLYGTPDLWYTILAVNKIPTILEFTKTKIKAIDPDIGLEVLNHIIEKHAKKLKANNADPKVLEDLTIKKIIV